VQVDVGPEEVVAQGRFLSLCRRAFAGGCWEYVARRGVHGIAVMFAVTDDDRVPLVRQYRIPVNAEVWELPAGLCDRDEDLRTTAVRELEEECGYTASEVRLLTRTPAAQAAQTAILDIYLLTGLTRVDPPPGDEVFPIHVELVPRAELSDFLLGRLAAGELVDARVFAALHLADRALG